MFYDEEELARLKEEALDTCPRCHGKGLMSWPNTAIGHGGIAGQAITDGPCDCTDTFLAIERYNLWCAQWREVKAPSMPMSWAVMRYRRSFDDPAGLTFEWPRFTVKVPWKKTKSPPRVWARALM